MLTVRKYEEKDKEGVRFACLNSDGPAESENFGKFILHTFCDYYIEKEPENCFVLSDDGNAVGYVICTEDYDTYREVFDKEYLPLNKDLGEELYKWAETSTVIQEKHKNEYPAHLHIDILPEYQRQGWGGKLIDALSEHLKAKGVRGVMLTTGSDNEKGCGFYRKYGFTEVDLIDGEIAFGLKF